MFFMLVNLIVLELAQVSHSILCLITIKSSTLITIKILLFIYIFQ